MTPDKEYVSWDIPVVGFAVYALKFGGDIQVLFTGPRPEGERFSLSSRISLAGDFTYVDDQGVLYALNAADTWDSLTLLFKLRHRIITLAVADNLSQIRIEFDDHSHLRAGPTDYENWELVGPADLHLVGLANPGDPRISGRLGM
jgi:hypothetical protein